MLARFLAGGACAVGMLAAVFVAPAAANPYDQQVRGSGRSLFATLFGPSTARAVVSYSGSQKHQHGTAPALSRARQRPGASNEPDSIGQATSSGCIRLTNEDVIDLYSRVRIGTPVIVQ